MGFKLEISIIGMSSWLVNCYDGHFIGPVIWQPYDILDFFLGWGGGGASNRFQAICGSMHWCGWESWSTEIYSKTCRSQRKSWGNQTMCLFFSSLFICFSSHLCSMSHLWFLQAYARIGMAKEAADAASQAKDGELLGRLKLSFAQNTAASSIFDTLRDRLSFQGVS